MGLTALSVERITILGTLNSSAISATLYVPKTLFLTASHGLSSISGTCLWAAAWKTTSGLNSSKISRSLSLSLTEPILTCASRLSPYSAFKSFNNSKAQFS